jgi:hypothetical protein
VFKVDSDLCYQYPQSPVGKSVVKKKKHTEETRSVAQAHSLAKVPDHESSVRPT